VKALSTLTRLSLNRRRFTINLNPNHNLDLRSFNPKTIPLAGNPKVILCSVPSLNTLRSFVLSYKYAPDKQVKNAYDCDLSTQNHTTSRISQSFLFIPYTKFEHFGFIRFWVKQTDKQTNLNILPRPIDRKAKKTHQQKTDIHCLCIQAYMCMYSSRCGPRMALRSDKVMTRIHQHLHQQPTLITHHFIPSWININNRSAVTRC